MKIDKHKQTCQFRFLISGHFLADMWAFLFFSDFQSERQKRVICNLKTVNLAIWVVLYLVSQQYERIVRVNTNFLCRATSIIKMGHYLRSNYFSILYSEILINLGTIFNWRFAFATFFYFENSNYTYLGKNDSYFSKNFHSSRRFSNSMLILFPSAFNAIVKGKPR